MSVLLRRCLNCGAEPARFEERKPTGPLPFATVLICPVCRYAHWFV